MILDPDQAIINVDDIVAILNEEYGYALKEGDVRREDVIEVKATEDIPMDF